MLEQTLLHAIAWFTAALVAIPLLLPAAAHAEPSAGASRGKRVALIIGNSAYPGKFALKNPENDAKAFAAALAKVSPKFKIIEVFDMKADAREARMKEFEAELKDAEMGLFYYAGHAFQYDDDNYLLPVDAPQDSFGMVSPDETKALKLNDVLGRMKDLKGAKLIFLDACRGNPYKPQIEASIPSETQTRQGGSAVRFLRNGLASPDASNFGTGDIFIAYATAPGAVAQDGKGSNSPFTLALVRYVGQQGLEIKKMQTNVTRDVKKMTQDKKLYDKPQIPWFSVSLTNDLYLWPPSQMRSENRASGTRSGGEPRQRGSDAPAHSNGGGGGRPSPPPGLGGGVGGGAGGF